MITAQRSQQQPQHGNEAGHCTCDPDDTFLCCPECGNTDFIEILRTTDQGRRYVLQCTNDDCAVVILQNEAEVILQ